MERRCGKTSDKEIVVYANNSPMIFFYRTREIRGRKKSKFFYFPHPYSYFIRQVVTFFNRRKERMKKPNK